ncbi:MAG: glycosyltransferase family 4 protein [Gaiellaceae bacterium]
MKVLIVTGIWPPDVGGPASHAPEIAGYLRAHGHRVEVITMADDTPALVPYPLRFVRRSLPSGIRHAAVAMLVARGARSADVVYEVSMLGRSALGSLVGRSPLVAKLPSDPAYERARRRGLFGGGMDAFQRFHGGPAVRALRLARNLELRRAAHIVCPSSYLRDMAVGWGVAAERVTVVPNAAPPLPDLPPAEELRRLHGIEGPTLAFAGRLTRQKALEVALAALALSSEVRLLVVGDGPERAALERRSADLGLGERVRFLGARPRTQVLELLRAADASLLSSAWENFPHAVVESLAVGTPVISTSVGGVSEAVQDGENGLLVPSGDPQALAAAIDRYFADEELRKALRAAALASAGRYAPERVHAQLEEVLRSAATA